MSGLQHSLSLSNRTALDISGVESILVFDSDYILIELQSEKIAVEGKDLKLINLIKDKKEVQINGKVSGIFYQDSSTKKSGIFKKK